MSQQSASSGGIEQKQIKKPKLYQQKRDETHEANNYSRFSLFVLTQVSTFILCFKCANIIIVCTIAFSELLYHR